MKVVNTFLLCVLVSLVMGSSIGQQNRLLQTTQRTASFTQMCASFSDRTLVSQKDQTDAENNRKIMQASFKLSGNQLINTVLTADGGALNGAMAILPSIQVQLGLFAGPFVLGLIIILFIWPFLCCCCCCPGCCPSKCCRKPDDQQYTKCQLIWPAVVLILASLLLAISSMIGITRASDIQKSYQAVGCSAAITFDDIVNGNVSSTGKYFIGMSGLVTTLNQLKANIPNIGTQMNKLKYDNTSSPLRLAYDQGTSLLNLMAQIPNGTAGQSMDPYTYVSFDGSGTAVTSAFPTILGSASPSSQSGATGIAYNVVNQINQGLKTIADGASSFSSQTGTISGTIDQLAGSMGNMANMVLGYDTQVTSIDSSISSIMKIVTIAVTAFFAVFIAFGVLNIIGVLLMTFCDKFSCRYLIYFTCYVLFILGILCFFLAFIFSAFVPIIYFGCDFLTTTISSPANFNTNLGTLLDAQLTSYIGVCLPGGTGDIISQLGVDISAINGLSTVVSQMRSYNLTGLQTGALAALTALSDQINKYYYTDAYDFDTSTFSADRNFLLKVARPSNYPTCNLNDFTTDNWIPSLRNSDISCSGTTRNAGPTQCPSNTQVTAGKSSTNCYGCMDSTKILLNAAVTTPAADITNRYGTGNSDCNAWAVDMNLILTNYYMEKNNKYGPVIGRMQSATNSFSSGSGYNQKLSDVGSVFPNIITILQGISSTIFDPQYGLIAGLNCLLLGQDINLLANTACNKLFNTLFFLRLTLGLAAFAILFILCCTTCSGVRAFKHSQRLMLVKSREQGFNQDQSTITALNQKY